MIRIKAQGNLPYVTTYVDSGMRLHEGAGSNVSVQTGQWMFVHESSASREVQGMIDDFHGAPIHNPLGRLVRLHEFMRLSQSGWIRYGASEPRIDASTCFCEDAPALGEFYLHLANRLLHAWIETHRFARALLPGKTLQDQFTGVLCDAEERSNKGEIAQGAAD